MMQKALEAVKQGMSKKLAAKTFKVPRSTLIFKIKFPDKIECHRGPRTVLNNNEELSLKAWLIECSLEGYPKRKEDLLYKVAEFLKKSQRPNPFKNGVPGVRWYKSFLKRHPDIAIIGDGFLEVNK